MLQLISTFFGSFVNVIAFLRMYQLVCENINKFMNILAHLLPISPIAKQVASELQNRSILTHQHFSKPNPSKRYVEAA